MRLFTTFFSASLVALAIGGQMSTPMNARIEQGLENHLIRRDSSHLLTGAASNRMMRKRGSTKTCKGKSKSEKHHSSSGSKSSDSSNSGKASSTNNDSEDTAKSTKSKGSSGSSKNDKGSKKSTSDSSSSGKGLEGMSFSGKCKSPKASSEHPNGDIDFLNCGISKSNPSSKWTPPKIKMSDIKTISASQAAKSSAFKACTKYESQFKKAESSTGVPAVMLMSFAMQESSCNPKVIGGNGEIGMMQLTPDKCNGANCHDAGTNIMMGAKYFKSQIDHFGGNVLEALGAYNGWSTSMSFSSATNQQYGCHSQNNLDYLNSFLNGWCQGKEGYSKKFLIYNNLASCPGD